MRAWSNAEPSGSDVPAAGARDPRCRTRRLCRRRQEGIDGLDGCKTQYPPPRDAAATIAFDQCVDGVQVTAFVCRDNAHEAARPGFVTCQQSFRTCVDTNYPSADQLSRS